MSQLYDHRGNVITRPTPKKRGYIGNYYRGAEVNRYRSPLPYNVTDSNVTLNKGEANLEKKSVVNISQVVTVNKSDLTEKIGSLSPEKRAEIIDGIKLLVDPLPDPRT